MIILIIFLVGLSAVLGFTTYNLLKKNETQEDILASYMTYLNKMSDIVEFSDKKLKEIDADDPVKYDFSLFGMGVFEKNTNPQ